jgi:hypothetical protein
MNENQRIDAHRCKVQDDGVQVRFCQVQILIRAGALVARTRIVPGTVAGLDMGHVSSTSHICLDVIDKYRIKYRCTGIDETLLKSVNKHLRGWRNDFEVKIGGNQWHVYFSATLRGIVKRNLSEEVPTRMSDANQEKSKRGTDGSVYAILNGRKY